MGFSSHAEAKQNHWFSRKHQAADAHVAVREANEARFMQKFDDAQHRAHEARNRKPEEQLARLDKMFGKGVGAQRERVKLARRIEVAKQPKPVATVTAERGKKGESPKRSKKSKQETR